MEGFINRDDKYEKILEVLCKYKGINKEELCKILKDQESKYLLFLLLKKYKCTNLNMLHKDFSIESLKSVNYNLRKAEEKFFVNKSFRDVYFEAEEIISKII